MAADQCINNNNKTKEKGSFLASKHRLKFRPRVSESLSLPLTRAFHLLKNHFMNTQ